MLRNATIEQYYNTIWCIAASRYVGEYMIGYTRRPLRNRLSEYSRIHGYQYMVVLSNGMTLAESMQLEQLLQDAVKQDRKHTLFKKYCSHRREQRYFPSQGPISASPQAPVHSVYMAWWDAYSE
jgi:hypothetical protein